MTSVRQAGGQGGLLTPAELMNDPTLVDNAMSAGMFGGSNSVTVPRSAMPGQAYAGQTFRSGLRGVEIPEEGLVPRKDVTDKFTFRRRESGTYAEYMNPDKGHGLDLFVDKEGILGFDIRASRDPVRFGSGRDMFISGMQRLEAEGVEVRQIRGTWYHGTDSVNAVQYRSNLAAGMTPELAASNTWTGKIAGDYGFTGVRIVQDGQRQTVVLFHR